MQQCFSEFVERLGSFRTKRHGASDSLQSFGQIDMRHYNSPGFNRRGLAPDSPRRRKHTRYGATAIVGGASPSKGRRQSTPPCVAFGCPTTPHSIEDSLPRVYYAEQLPAFFGESIVAHQILLPDSSVCACIRSVDARSSANWLH